MDTKFVFHYLLRGAKRYRIKIIGDFIDIQNQYRSAVMQYRVFGTD